MARPETKEILTTLNDPIKMDVGIEDWLHLSFELDRTKYSTKDVITGKVTFKTVSMKLKLMLLQIIRRETIIGGEMDNAVLCKFEIMDGGPIKNEIVPIRFCKKIVNQMDNLVKEHKKNIKICFYTLIKGFHENRTNDINEKKDCFEVSFIPSIEGEPPFDYIEKDNEIRLISKLTKLSMHVTKKGEIKKNEEGIAFTIEY